jgi:hypothetical protein
VTVLPVGRPEVLGLRRRVPAHFIPTHEIGVGGVVVGREAGNVSFQQSVSGVFDESSRMSLIRDTDPEQQVGAIAPQAGHQITDISFGRWQVAFPDKDPVRRLQILQQFAAPELKSPDLTPPYQLRVDAALMRTGMERKIPARLTQDVLTRILLAARFQGHRVRIAQSGEAISQSPDGFAQAVFHRNPEAGEAHQIEVLFSRPSLRHAKLAIVPKALK